MKKIVLVLGLFVILSINTFSQQDFFPLEVGNYWQFKGTHYSSFDSSWVFYDNIEILKDTLLGNPPIVYKKIKSIILPPFYIDSIQYLRYDSTINSVVEFHIWDDTSNTLFNYNAQLFECWSAWYKEICYVSFDTTSLFNNTEFSKTYHGGTIPTFTYKLLKNFGPILIIDDQSYVITSYTVYELVYAKINGIEYGQFVSVDDKNLDIPSEFSLSQNYPNPFNPNTKISYLLPNAGNVTLKVFDVLGKEVATLVNEEKQVGSYEVQFDGNRLTSGIYFYQIKTGDFTETKKMILLK